jgi:hypothetical protein
VINLQTPITLSVAYAFAPSNKWDEHIKEAQERCRAELARITRVIARRYAREQWKERTSEVQRISI